jgi:hypothetical protein
LSAGQPAKSLVTEDCSLDVDAASEPESRLHELAAHCAPGLVPIDAPVVTVVRAGETHTLSFELADARHCVRAIAAGDAELGQLEIELLDEHNRSYGHEVHDDNFALLNPRGTICVGAPGTYRLLVRVGRGQGRVAMAAYRAR